MGRDKARLRLGRRTLLGQIRETALSAGLPVRVIRKDVVDRCGPLGGVYTGLRRAKSAAVLFLSCDMPFVTEALLRAIVDAPGSKTQAVFTKHDLRFGFPFLVRRDALAVVEGLIIRKELSLQQLARELHAKPFRVPKPMREALFNVNTREDYQLARKRIRALHHGC